MTSSDPDIRPVPPALAGGIAILGYPLGVLLLTFVPQRLGAPTWVLAPLAVLGAVLGYLASRAVLRRLYSGPTGGQRLDQ